MLELTKRGSQVLTPLELRARNAIGALLDGLPETQQRELLHAMRMIQHLLGPPREQELPYLLRPHQPGDIGWVVHRHGILYSSEYGFNWERPGN